MSKEITQTIIIADPGGEQLVQFARETAIKLVKQNLTRSQIRNIFTEVRKIEALWDAQPDSALRRLNMLKPKLAYATARNDSVRDLQDVLSRAIDAVNQADETEERKKRFQRFMDLFEAILAYHRAEGGRN
jgi:CRISPR-associated protein Csm2